MFYSLQTICSVTRGEIIQDRLSEGYEHLLFDSRRIVQPASSVFFAIITFHGDGHYFIKDAYDKGVRCFVISSHINLSAFPGAAVILVENTVQALQDMAAHHRLRFNYPVIAITGSNGKTIIKEWLYQLLHTQMKIHRSPKSYNSQLGVPLSIWGMSSEHDLAIIEAGVSLRGEMKKLQRIIRPTIGLLTNLGKAHDEGFASAAEKLQEKCLLFNEAEVVIGELELLEQSCPDKKRFTWSRHQKDAYIFVSAIERQGSRTQITTIYGDHKNTITIPFSDEASIQNAIHCIAVLLYLNLNIEEYREKFASLTAVDMRLQLKQGINDCVVINDSYSADTNSLRIALDFLQQQSAGRNRTVVLSDFVETGKSKQELYQEIIDLLTNYTISKVVIVGRELADAIHKAMPGVPLLSFASTEELLLQLRGSQFYKEIILVKGARMYEFERVAALFERKQHQTVLEIDLNKLVHNLKQYQQLLQPGTGIMAMVKAFSYGSGGSEIASVLQFHRVQYLGVAYADEGVDLVKAGISLPIMVMNAEASGFPFIVEHRLQPVIYSFAILEEFEAYIGSQGLSAYPVHLEIETGMNRLGFSVDDIEKLAIHLGSSPLLKVQTVFSHLAASEEKEQDNFTLQQADIFTKAVAVLRAKLPYSFLQHILNSAGIVRHPQLQFDLVRLGIGLYGVEVDGEDKLDLHPVATLRSTIAQVKHLKKGESVSYNRRGRVEKDSTIATVRIGYADGYNRAFGYGKGKMVVHGQVAPTIGTICMDMTMIDVTHIPGVSEGDDVIVFGPELPVEEVAGWINTIPYEIMTSVSQRVKRVYFHE